MVVEGGHVLHHVKREGNCPGVGNVRGWGYVQGKCPAGRGGTVSE